MKKIALIGATGLDWWVDEKKKSFIDSITPHGYEIHNFVPDFGTHSVESHVDEAYNAPFILDKIVEAHEKNYDAIVIDCACDPVLVAGREAVDTPVIGARNSALHIALTLGTKFSIITVQGQSLMRCMHHGVRMEGLEEFLSSVRYLKMPVLDITNDPEEAQNELRDESRKAIEHDGADVIVLGCTGLSHQVDTKSISQELGVPILDPLVVAVNAAVAIVESGLAHSKIAYPSPPKKDVKEIPSLNGKFDKVLKK
jgi:allantoin racemase